MFKKIFLAFAALIFLGTGAGVGLIYNAINQDADKNKAVASDILTNLSRRWDLMDVGPNLPIKAVRTRPVIVSKAAWLGKVQRIDSAQQTKINVGTSTSEGQSKAVTVIMVGQFENGRAQVTFELKSEDGVLRLHDYKIDFLTSPPSRA